MRLATPKRLNSYSTENYEHSRVTYIHRSRICLHSRCVCNLFRRRVYRKNHITRMECGPDLSLHPHIRRDYFSIRHSLAVSRQCVMSNRRTIHPRPSLTIGYKIDVYRASTKGWRVQFIVDQQFFDIGPEFENQNNAQWFAEQFQLALAKISAGRNTLDALWKTIEDSGLYDAFIKDK